MKKYPKINIVKSKQKLISIVAKHIPNYHNKVNLAKHFQNKYCKKISQKNRASIFNIPGLS